MGGRKDRLKKRICERRDQTPALSCYLISRNLSLPGERVLQEWLFKGVERILSSALPSIWSKFHALGPCLVEIRNEYAVAEMSLEAFEMDADRGEARVVRPRFSIPVDLNRIEDAYFRSSRGHVPFHRVLPSAGKSGVQNLRTTRGSLRRLETEVD